MRKQQILRYNATTLKEKLLKQINQELVPYLNTSINMDVDAYGSFIIAVNAIIEDQNMLIKKRKNKAEISTIE
ncbi:MAG: hypothetical protein ACK5JS_00745 [Mangrovibacterium sp.]